MDLEKDCPQRNKARMGMRTRNTLESRMESRHICEQGEGSGFIAGLRTYLLDIVFFYFAVQGISTDAQFRGNL
jgi:hypothetical protein